MGKRVLFMVLGVLLFFGCVSAPPKSEDLLLFSPEGSGFSILLPGTPEYKTEAYTNGSAEFVSHIYTFDEGYASYLVSYMDYPDAVLEADPQVVLNGYRDGAVANVKGKLFSEKVITLNGYPGKEFTIVIGTQYMYTKVYLVNKRLYSVMAMGQGYRQVVDSFNLTET